MQGARPGRLYHWPQTLPFITLFALTNESYFGLLALFFIIQILVAPKRLVRRNSAGVFRAAMGYSLQCSSQVWTLLNSRARATLLLGCHLPQSFRAFSFPAHYNSFCLQQREAVWNLPLLRRGGGAFPHRLLSYAKESSVVALFVHGTLRTQVSGRNAFAALRRTNRLQSTR